MRSRSDECVMVKKWVESRRKSFRAVAGQTARSC